MATSTLHMLLMAGFLWLGPAAAEDAPADRAGPGATAEVVDGRVTTTDATRSPRSGAMLGAACSFRTGQMARRVVNDGDSYTYVGSLQQLGEARRDVACPYSVGGQSDTCVVASELVEVLAEEGVADRELALEGRILEVDGIRYVVLTAYQPSAS